MFIFHHPLKISIFQFHFSLFWYDMLIDCMQPGHKYVILSAALAASKDLRTEKPVRSCHYFGVFGSKRA